MTRRYKQPCLWAASSALVTVGVSGCADSEEKHVEDGASQEIASVNALQASEQPDVRMPYFMNVTADGKGCPAGSTSLSYLERKTRFSLRFGSYALRINQDSDPQITLNCMIRADIWAPPGMEYAVVGMMYAIHVDLEDGVVARPSFTYEFLGGSLTPRTVSTREPIVGPRIGDVELKDEVTADTAAYSGCGNAMPLTIRTALTLRNSETRNGGGATVREAEGAMELVARTVGRPCKATK